MLNYGLVVFYGKMGKVPSGGYEFSVSSWITGIIFYVLDVDLSFCKSSRSFLKSKDSNNSKYWGQYDF